MKLQDLHPAPGAKTKAFRKGRGAGSGNGKTAGKGHKGQNARSGGGVYPGFEGGQMKLSMRIPKRGFTNVFRTEYTVVNVGDLDKRFEDGAVVNEQSLREAGLVTKTLDGIKILAKGDLGKKLTVQAAAFSESAKQKIEQVGGKVEVV
jgi:large subunit ribosomal protein L15